MKSVLSPFLILTILISCQPQAGENGHTEPTHNFTVKRLLILNDNNEVLMGKEAGNWYTPSLIYSDRQYLQEALDSLANAFGVSISTPKLHGYFSYKYEYHPYATLRAYYIAYYDQGAIKATGPMTEVKWMPVDEAISATPVESMKQCITQILQHPDTLWSASFMVFRKGEHHHAKMEGDFYPLFN